MQVVLALLAGAGVVAFLLVYANSVKKTTHRHAEPFRMAIAVPTDSDAETPHRSTPTEGGAMPGTTSKAAEFAALKAKHAQEVADFLADNPSAFEVSTSLDDSEIAEKVLVMTRKHLRRFPKTDCALALSIKALFEGKSTTYQR